MIRSVIVRRGTQRVFRVHLAHALSVARRLVARPWAIRAEGRADIDVVTGR